MMTQRTFTGTLVSDFNIDNLAAVLNNNTTSQSDVVLQVSSAPFGQVMPTLLNPSDPTWSEDLDFAVIWTRAEAIVESFHRVLQCLRPDAETLLAEVDQFADAILAAAGRTSFVLVPTWTLSSEQRGLGLLDQRPGGISHSLALMNNRLAERLADTPNVYVLDASRWLAAVGANAYSPKFWLMGKIPFGNELFKQAASDIQAAIEALAGETRKLIVVDLDDTMWGGIVGDDGWENLKLGGHDAIGESFVAFQQELKALQNRGILLAIVSKNTEEVALEAIDQHPEMVLRRDDFIAWRINWHDKAANVAAIVKEVNLGLQSVVFIDDNPSERARVAEQLPEVLVPDWPKEKMLYTQALRALTCFDSPSLSEEDKTRTEMYVAERGRRQAQESIGSMDDWLQTLDLQVHVEPLNDGNVKRITQLLNKTNQMNLTTRRQTEAELSEWGNQPGNQLFGLRIADRFGDSGLTGIVGVETNGDTCQIIDFILSCRVFGRQIEQLMAAVAVEFAQSAGMSTVSAQYLPTKKNKPCLEFWKSSGFSHDEATDCFTWDTTKSYETPSHITVHHEACNQEQSA